MHLDLIKKIFHDKEGLLLVQLTDYNYTRMVLLLPRSIKKKPSAKHTIASLEVMTYIKITYSYYWLGIYQDVKMHMQTCPICHLTKPTLLSPLPILECPNWRIHADLFGPMLTANSDKKFMSCITDAFTKYAVVTSIQNKNAKTVADVIFKEWFCKFGIAAQIYTDGGKHLSTSSPPR